MTTLLQRGAEWLGQQLQTAAGQAVSYRRAAQRASITAASAGWYDQKSVGLEGEEIVVRVRRYTFVTADLLFGTRPFVPQDGDRVIETINGQQCEFEVMPAKQSPSFGQTDPNGILTEVYAARVNQ